MKKVLVLTFFAAVLLTACLKTTNTTPTVTDCVPVSPATEEPTIKTFTGADSIAFTKDTSYIYYHISDSGTGAVANTTIFFTYTASLLNGTVLSTATTPVTSAVVNLIQGFQDMKRFYKKGAHIILVIPSSLAYGCQGVVQNNVYVIPPNSVVYYDFTITDVQ